MADNKAKTRTSTIITSFQPIHGEVINCKKCGRQGRYTLHKRKGGRLYQRVYHSGDGKRCNLGYLAKQPKPRPATAVIKKPESVGELHAVFQQLVQYTKTLKGTGRQGKTIYRELREMLEGYSLWSE